MTSAPSAATAPLTDGDYDTLNDILADVAQRAEGAVPEDWEYCDGFLTALLCMRREVPPSEYFPVLFGAEPGSAIGLGMVPFRDAAQMQTFVQLWQRRRDEIATALAQPVEELDDPRTLQPAWQDLRGWAAGLDEGTRGELLRELDAPLPPIGQYWAVGFTDVVQAWPEDWKPPRERELARAWREALAHIEALLDDDTDAPLPPEEDGTPVGYSAQRLQRLGEAVWAAYDLHDIARELGPPVAPVRKTAQPGRNDPCPCGSGQKFKKCCGAPA